MMRWLIVLFAMIASQALGQNVLSTRSKKAVELYTEADNYRVRGQFTQAIGLLNEALEKDKGFVEAWYRLGLVYMSMKDYQKANSYFEKGLTLTQDVRKQKVFWYDLGDSYFKIGEYAKSEKYLNAFLAVEQSHRQKIDHAKLLLKNIAFARGEREFTLRICHP